MSKKKERAVDVAILGAGTAGTAGLAALAEIKKTKASFVLIDGGTLGTTCARVGCMPSKALIQVANDFHRRTHFSEFGISGADGLKVNLPKVLAHVRKLRDYYVGHVLKSTEGLGDCFIPGFAEFLGPDLLQVSTGEKIRAKSIVLATGSKPIVPPDWNEFKKHILTTDDLFEQKDIQGPVAVIGTGVIGLELGQALQRLGLDVTITGRSTKVGGLSDPTINTYAAKLIGEASSLHLGCEVHLSRAGDSVEVKLGPHIKKVRTLVVCIGRSPQLDGLHLEKAGVKVDDKGKVKFDPETMQIKGTRIFIAGDNNAEKPLLHEASDEGKIAGYNATRKTPTAFKRRVALAVTFCDPNIASVGKRFRDLEDGKFAVGEVSFEDQGRARLMAKNKGLLRVYGEFKTGKILGAEMMAPDGEHLSHLLALAIQKQMTAGELLELPFYHPTLEEGLRTALRGLNKLLDLGKGPLEISKAGKNSPARRKTAK